MLGCWNKQLREAVGVERTKLICFRWFEPLLGQVDRCRTDWKSFRMLQNHCKLAFEDQAKPNHSIRKVHCLISAKQIQRLPIHSTPYQLGILRFLRIYMNWLATKYVHRLQRSLWNVCFGYLIQVME